MIPRPIRVIVFCVACGIIVWLSLAPTDALPSVSQWDKVEHAGAYAALALLGAWAHRTGPWPVAAGLVALGVGLEIAQSAMGWGRQGDVLDVLANSLGIAVGLGLARLVGERLMVKSPARGE